MTVKRRFLVGAAAVHLGLAAMYAPHIPVEPHLPRALDRAFAFYGSFSGVRTHFDFFAPSVSTQARVEYRITSQSGEVRHVRLATPNGEVNNRIAMMLTFYAYGAERDRLMRSWGEYALGLHPDAVEVETRIEVAEIPPFERSAGAGPAVSWQELGRGVVKRGALPAT